MRYLFVCVIALFWPVAAQAQHYNSYGLPGLIDMPVASSAPDAELAFTLSHFAGQTRGSATFQLSNRLSASLGYARLRNLADADGRVYPEIFDRSFGLHYRLFDETKNRPAIAIGVNDLVGTGVYAGEYVVATKTLSPHFSATLGLGWGRLASYGGTALPLGDRPTSDIGEGGTIAGNALFRGDAALFGGVHYQLRDDIALIAEYSSDGYRAENGRAFTHRSPVNVGLSYQPRNGLALAAYYQYGSEIGLHAHYRLDPKSVAAPPVPPPEPAPRMRAIDWELKPYILPNLFDPDAPLRADFGIASTAAWQISPRVTLSGSLRQRIAGNLHQTTRESDSHLPHVRSDFALYGREGDLDINRLTLTWRGQPLPHISTRITAGLLEEMYAGLSAEMLWQKPDAPFAVGVEINALQQRGFHSDFRLRDYQVISGHGSLYWDAGAGRHVQLDVGRYLAGDWGATLTLARHFESGWSLGAFATLTDVPFSQFGEGSFDKGIIFTIPLGNGRALSQTIRPVTRDGGARVYIDDRLYVIARASP
ncbi:Exopolysaccharide biosynthesis protein YbjH [Yoonia tamlensis]|uniref:Exopolysaccharide biosynthesis protein YbjH n=1 Tax=Yoonia tamlensis TaxID=390270 RepID=A0A1I6GQZ4_9RHOB|nr:YjbH domain-containing protein [Yoonia tamlensis]SFR44608.1 Exopolysaccharide biosynthesis protein YbjH [Yoonia tamlensis]